MGRGHILDNAGVIHVRDAAAIDESAIKDDAHRDGATIIKTATLLAIKKAEVVSSRHPGAYVVGADQMLECDGRWFDKAVGEDSAMNQLRILRGRTHKLVTAVVVTKDEKVLWQHVDTAQLTMRMFSDNFLNHYVKTNCTNIIGSVGCYRIESVGAQLFEAIEGNHFTILGLPLVPLLSFLRSEGVSPT